jgi:hypothetical protein
MTQTAPVTALPEWNDLIDALYDTDEAITDLRDTIANHPQQEPETMTDPDALDIDAELDDERRRLEYETDTQLNRDFDRDEPDPTDPDLEQP